MALGGFFKFIQFSHDFAKQRPRHYGGPFDANVSAGDLSYQLAWVAACDANCEVLRIICQNPCICVADGRMSELPKRLAIYVREVNETIGKRSNSRRASGQITAEAANGVLFRWLQIYGALQASPAQKYQPQDCTTISIQSPDRLLKKLLSSFNELVNRRFVKL